MFTGLAIAFTGLLSLMWTVLSFFLRRDFSDVTQLQECYNATPSDDPLRHAFRAAVLERLYRNHYPARRQALVFLNIWVYSLLFSFIVSMGDTARTLRDYFPPERMWIATLGVAVFLGFLMWGINGSSYKLRENIAGRADDMHARYRALCFEERRRFLEITNGTHDPKLGWKGWTNGILGPNRRRRKPTTSAVGVAADTGTPIPENRPE